MKTSEYKHIFENEESHFYYKGIHSIVFSLIKKYKKGNNLKILDAGCGTGLLAYKLRSLGKVYGVDMHPEAIKYSRIRGINALKASVNDLPFKNNQFDVITSIDVIYHKAVNDKKALLEFFRVLKRNGILVLRVPAVSWLKRSVDKHVFTRKRYDLEVLENKLRSTGFDIKKISYINCVLFFPALVSHIWERILRPKKTESPVTKVPPWLNSFLTSTIIWEGKIIGKIRLPIGLGLIAVCQKN